MNVFSSIIIATLSVSAISLIGGALFIKKKFFTDRFLHHLISFAAGVLLATAFLDLLPEAFDIGGQSSILFLVTFLGVVVFFFLERFTLWFHHHDDVHKIKVPAVLILIGDSLHNFFDGILIAASFLANSSLGLVSIVAIAAHEIPQEIADLSILLYTGMSKKKALLFNFFSATTAFVGALIGFYFLKTITFLLSYFLAFSAGMFIYIACSDLIPDMHKDFDKQKGWLQSIPFLFGILMMWFFVHALE